MFFLIFKKFVSYRDCLVLAANRRYSPMASIVPGMPWETEQMVLEELKHHIRDKKAVSYASLEELVGLPIDQLEPFIQHLLCTQFAYCRLPEVLVHWCLESEEHTSETGYSSQEDPQDA